MVSAADPRAAEAGAEILRQGGSAIDAAIATLLALNVVEPQSSGIGGGGFCCSAKGGDAVTFDGRETAPTAATGTWFLEGRQADGHSVTRNPRRQSVGVPGNFRLMAMAHARYGKLPWAALFQPAIKLARDGFGSRRALTQVARQQPRAPGALSAQGRALFYRRRRQAAAGGHGDQEPGTSPLPRSSSPSAGRKLLCGAERAGDRRRQSSQRAAQSGANDARRPRLLRGQAAPAGVRRVPRLPHLRHGPALVGRRRPFSRPEAARALRPPRARAELAGRLASDRRIEAPRLCRPRAHISPTPTS